MRVSAIVATVLFILLIGSNAFWVSAYQQSRPAPDVAPAVSCSATNNEIFSEVAAPLARAIAAAALPGASRESVLLAAEDGTGLTSPNCINQEGAYAVRGIALFFAPDGKLTSAATGICVP